MDVRCTRCQTEYELDDALVSDRGTMVKCTNCGLQFRVQPEGARGKGERWIVRKKDGKEISFSALSELQRAIANRQVHSDDLLSRDNQAFRPLGSIVELEPFFAAAQGRPSAPPAGTPEIAGPAAQPLASVGGVPAIKASRTLVGISPDQAIKAPQSAKRQGITLVGITDGPQPAQPAASTPEADIPTRPRAVPEEELPTRPVNALPGDILPSSNVPRDVTLQGMPSPGRAGLPSVMVNESVRRADYSQTSGAPRAAHLRWVVALVMLGGIGLAAGTLGRKYLNDLEPAPRQAANPASQRVAELVRNGEQLFYQGDLEGARAEFDKATALSERDPMALSYLARVESVRADTVWLKLRLLAPDGAERSSTEQELAARLAKLEAAVAAAKRAAGEHPSVVRAELNALRIAGRLSQARELAPKLSSATAEPETDYVLGALDLADQAPSWGSVIERLRTASAVERGLGRARALLVFALLSADRKADAQAELDKLAAEPPRHPLLPLLQAFVDGKEAPPEEEAPSDAVPAAAASTPAAAAPATGAAPSSDQRVLLQRASAARRAGKLEQAEQYYHMALQANPGNVEALSALGELAFQRGDFVSAQRHFEAALHTNPHYLPALVGLADIKWAQGQRAQAAELYQRVVDRSGTTTHYGARAASRLAEYRGKPASEPSPPPASAPAAPAPAPSAPAPAPSPAAPAPAPAPSAPPSAAPEAPHIDTTDLPEFQK